MAEDLSSYYAGFDSFNTLELPFALWDDSPHYSVIEPGSYPTAAELLAEAYAADPPPFTTVCRYPYHEYDTVGDYFDSMGTYDLLDGKEELFKLAQLKDKGDEAAFQRMVTGNLRWVVSRTRTNDPDTIGAGNLGLVLSAQRFDWTKELTLTNFSAWEILKQVREQTIRMDFPVRIGRDTFTEYRHFTREVDEGVYDEFINASLDKADEIKDEEESAKRAYFMEMQAVGLAMQGTSLDYFMGWERDGDYSTDASNIIADQFTDTEDTALHNATNFALQGEVGQLMDALLKPDQKQAIELFYGFETEGLSYAEAAAAMGISQNKFERIISGARRMIKDYAAYNGLTYDDFLG